MNVKVITRHAPSNYGSLLQSIATVHVIEQLGHSCEIIDYQRPDERGLSGVLSQLGCKQGYSNPLKKLAYVLVRYPIEKYAQIRFDRMRKKYLRLTSHCSSHDDLTKLSADVFLTGSDQVWGPTMNGHYDSAYFLQFVPDGIPKLAYAGSFGKTKFSDEVIGKYRQMLARYDQIAVREDSAVAMMKEWGLTNCVGQVLDPTLLLGADIWKKLLVKENQSCKYVGKKYILVYQIHNDPKLSDYARRLAKHKGWELKRVNPLFHQCTRGGKFVCCPDVGEFLSLIDNASCLVTDSFHGTCFAINFGKQFVEILPNTATSSRNQSILTLTGLENRILRDFDDFSLVDYAIDYLPVHNVIENERRKSLQTLKVMLDSF